MHFYGPGRLLRNPPDYAILDINIFDNFILFEKWFTKVLQIIFQFLNLYVKAIIYWAFHIDITLD